MKIVHSFKNTLGGSKDIEENLPETTFVRAS
jgi:hypothetical protein